MIRQMRLRTIHTKTILFDLKSNKFDVSNSIFNISDRRNAEKMQLNQLEESFIVNRVVI